MINQSEQAKLANGGTLLLSKMTFGGEMELRIQACDGFGRFAGDWKCARVSVMVNDMEANDSHIPISLLKVFLQKVEEARESNAERHEVESIGFGNQDF